MALRTITVSLWDLDDEQRNLPRDIPYAGTSR